MAVKLFAGVTATLCLLTMVVTAGATDLTGGWKGTLISPDGSQAEVQIDFSPQGFPLCQSLVFNGVADFDRIAADLTVFDIGVAMSRKV